MLVVEEYDKLDCHMRGFFRQLLENGRIANVTLNRYSTWQGKGKAGWLPGYACVWQARQLAAVASRMTGKSRATFGGDVVGIDMPALVVRRDHGRVEGWCWQLRSMISIICALQGHYCHGI